MEFFRRRVAILLVLTVLISTVIANPAEPVIYARAEDHIQTIYSPTGDEIYQVLITDKGQLKIIGHHFGGTGKKAYQTVGFFISMSPQNSDIRSFLKKGGKGYELRFDENTGKYVKDVNDNGYITTTYTFPDNVLSELFRIFNISSTASGSFNFYISNIFRSVYYPDGRGKPFVYTSEACYSLAEIRAASTWSAKTYDTLSHYYDMKFVVKRSWVKNTVTPTPTKKPTNTPTPTKKPTNTPTPTKKPTNTPTPTKKPTNTPTPTKKPTNTPTPTKKPTNTPTPTKKPTNTPTPTKKPTNTPTPTRRPTNTPTATPHPTSTPTPRPTNTPTPRPTNTPTPTPSNTPTPTPFLCKLIVSSDNRKYVQLIEPDVNALPLVIENNSEMNDFYVRIINNPLGTPGQGELKNEIRFPFDLYDDTENIGMHDKAVKIPAMTWYEIGDGTHHLYTTSEIREGSYYLEGRSSLRNAVKGNSNTSKEKTDAISVQISGRLTDFSITVKKGYVLPAATGWYDSGVINRSYTNNSNLFDSGIRDRMGNLMRPQTQQLPLFIKNRGTELLLEVTTCGKESELGEVVVKTSFRTPKGEPVRLFYYDVGPNGSRALRPVEDEFAMKLVEKKKSEQLWEYYYYIPENIIAMISGKRGYYSGEVIINFDISLASSKGKAVLSYSNSANEPNGFCNMWHFRELAKKIADESGNQYEIVPGDVLILNTGNSSAGKGDVRLLY